MVCTVRRQDTCFWSGSCLDLFVGIQINSRNSRGNSIDIGHKDGINKHGNVSIQEANMHENLLVAEGIDNLDNHAYKFVKDAFFVSLRQHEVLGQFSERRHVVILNEITDFRWKQVACQKVKKVLGNKPWEYKSKDSCDDCSKDVEIVNFNIKIGQEFTPLNCRFNSEPFRKGSRNLNASLSSGCMV